MADFIIDDTVDITDVVCPTTFVKAKVALEELDDGQILSVKMNDGEPVQNVPRSIKEEGHQILKLIDNEDGTYNLIVKRLVIKCRQESVKTILKKKFYRQIKLYSLIFIQTAVCLVKDFHRYFSHLKKNMPKSSKLLKLI